MPTEPEKTAHPWEEIAEQLSQEHDRSRVAELVKKLNEAMLAEEREKVRQRLGKPFDAIAVSAREAVNDTPTH